MSGGLTAVSLFAGIGGFDLALARAGVEVAAAVEIDPACRTVLARHFPETTLFPDVSEVTVDQLRTAGFVPGRGILAAGWPCQGNSLAGHRRGMDDPRSGLWRHVVRLLDAARPRWFLGENVPGLLSASGGLDFRTVLSDLDDLGYGVAWRVLDAQRFGLAQRRRRVFLAGCLGDGTAPVQVLLEPESGGWNTPPGRQARPGAARPAGRRAGSAGGHAGRRVAPPLLSGARPIGTSADDAAGLVVSTLQGGGRRGHRIDAEGAAGGHLVPVTGTLRTHPRPTSAGPGAVVTVAHTVTAREAKGADSDATSGVILAHTLTAEGADASEDGTGRGTPIVADTAAVRRLTPRECERLQGFPDDWTVGQSDAARYRQLGNAIAVPVAAWITRRLAAAAHREKAA
jgi:DNA (cytosine-5)-methyltransferase 1